MSKKFLILITFIIILFALGCTHRIGDFTIISTKNVNMNAPHYFYNNKQVTGEDKKLLILGASVGTPDLKEAIDNALEQTNGAVALTNVKLRYKYWHLILFGFHGYEAVGNPVFEGD